MKTPMETKEHQMIDSKTLKEALRFDDVALRTTANLISTLYLLNMSDRVIDVDQRHNFGKVKDLIASTMGYDLFELETVVNFWDCDFCFKQECTMQDVEDLYNLFIDELKEEENNKRFGSTVNEVATIKNASTWQFTNDKMKVTFCMDLLGMNLAEHGDNLCAHFVANLEDLFDMIIKEEF